jgi:hypothetical protein
MRIHTLKNVQYFMIVMRLGVALEIKVEEDSAATTSPTDRENILLSSVTRESELVDIEGRQAHVLPRCDGDIQGRAPFRRDG